MQNVTERAITAIGPFEPSEDWKIAPEKHAASLPGEAQSLARIMRNLPLIKLIGVFKSSDEQAVKQQKRYKSLGRTAIVLHTAVLSIGGATLLSDNVASQYADTSSQIGSLILGGLQTMPVLQILLLVLAIIAAQIIVRAKPFGKWMQSRARAEIARIEMFQQITSTEASHQEGEIPLLPLQLEYFRRYQLEMQMAYYGQRGEQHRQAAESRAKRKNVYTALAAFAAAPVTFIAASTFLEGDASFSTLSDMISNWDSAILTNAVASPYFVCAGIIASALISAQSSLSLLSQDERNANRYALVHENLVHLHDVYLDRARAAAVRGDREAVTDYINTVNDLISSEHKEWISLQEQSIRPDFETIAASRLPKLSTF